MTSPPPGAPSTRVAAAPPRQALEGGVRLQVTAGPDRGRNADLGLGTWIVGTDPAATVVLTDPLVSRRHLQVAVGTDELRITDLGSTNGSYYQGARFASLALAPGAVLRLGDTEIKLLAPADGADGGGPGRFGRLVGASPAMQQIFTLLDKVAPTGMPVLVQGETGTGKELLAEALHAASGRAGPFVICDCAAPGAAAVRALFGAEPPADGTGGTPGAFVEADRGTLLLDQIGDLDRDVQPRLLRALERRQVSPTGAAGGRAVDVRVVAATNRDLDEEVEQGRLRQDLYHRLSAFRIVLPPLRERREDIPLLVARFLAETCGDRPPPAVAPSLMAALVAHDWPGNARQLRNVLERAVVLSGGAPVLDAELLGLDPAAPPDTVTRQDTGRIVPFKEAKERLVDAWEREYVQTVLERTKGNISLAARRAGITRVYLHQLIKKHSFER